MKQSNKANKQTKCFFRLANFQIVQNCFAKITEIIGSGEIPLVTIQTDSERARSIAQNSLYWLWVTQIGNELGNDKDTQHTLLKRQFLSKIYARDDGEFAEMADSVRHCQKYLPPNEYEALAVSVAKQISITKATMAQFSEYLGDIERWAYIQGIKLTMPQELIWAK